MKCYSCPNQEKTTAVDLSALINLVMSPESIHGSFEGINLEGRNNGAAMITRRNSSSESSDCCGVSIYINNNVQGVNNSILVGSEVTMGDPGVCLSLKDVKFGRGSLGAEKMCNSALGFSWLLITVVVAMMPFLFLWLI